MLAGLRTLFAGFCFLLWAWLCGERKLPSKVQLKNTAMTGILMLSLSNGLCCVALKTVPTGITTLIISTVPIYSTLFFRIWGTRTSLLEWGGMGIAVLGIAILSLDTSIAIDTSAIILLLIAAGLWAFTSAMIPHIDLPSNKMASALQMLFASLTSLLCSFFLDEKMSPLVTEALLGLLYLAIFGSVLGFYLYTYLLHHARPALATSYAYVSPIIAVALGAIVIEETVNVTILSAMTIILSGVGLIVWEQNRKLTESPQPS
jgi:drug/metabolite transporter (DMT)-like permease